MLKNDNLEVENGMSLAILRKFPFEGWLNDPNSKVVKVTNPTFGDQVGSRRLNHLGLLRFCGFFFRIVGSSKSAYSGEPK